MDIKKGQGGAVMDWISVKESLPEVGVPVFAYGKNDYGKGRRIRATFAAKFTVEDEEFQGDADYNEENDTYYWPEGWYENNECEDVHWMVTFPITHWMPLPPPPEDE